MQTVKELLDTTINGLQKNEPALANALKKWLPLLKSTANDLQRITHKDPIDLTQDLLLAVVEANVAYKAPLFRYKGRLYEMDMQDGKCARLITPMYKKTKKLEKFWVQYKHIVSVKKSSLASYMYKVIRQQYLDMLTLYFTQRNGWLRTSAKKCKIKTVERIGQEILECDFSTKDSEMFSNMFKDTHSDQESTTAAREMLKKIMYRISQNALVVLAEMLESPYSSNTELSRCCNLSKNVVFRCKKQIKRAALDLTTVQPLYFTKVEPIHLTTCAA
jgi:hypothetical protein